MVYFFTLPTCKSIDEYHSKCMNFMRVWWDKHNKKHTYTYRKHVLYKYGNSCI